uniref:Uncharacterized protein n=1 Tax=Populus trichocarpa TaxID=3694 RepID=A0A3N7HCL5_POPTR
MKMKIDSVEGSYLDPLDDKVRSVLIGSVALEMAHRIFYTMLPSSVEQFIIELVAWAGSWYDFFHLDGTHPVKVEPLLKSKVWIIIFLFDYLKQGFRV